MFGDVLVRVCAALTVVLQVAKPVMRSLAPHTHGHGHGRGVDLVQGRRLGVCGAWLRGFCARVRVRARAPPPSGIVGLGRWLVDDQYQL